MSMFTYAPGFDLTSGIPGATVFSGGDRPPTVPSANSLESSEWMSAPSTMEPTSINLHARPEPGFSLFNPMAPTPSIGSSLYSSAEAELARLEQPAWGAGRPVVNRNDTPMNDRVTPGFTCRMNTDTDPWPLGSPMFGRVARESGLVHYGVTPIEVESLVTLNYRLARESLDPLAHPETCKKSSDDPAAYLREVANDWMFIGFLAELTRSSDDTSLAVFATTFWGHAKVESIFVQSCASCDKAPRGGDHGGFVFGLIEARTARRTQYEFGSVRGTARVASVPTGHGHANQLIPHVRALATHSGMSIPERKDVEKCFAVVRPASGVDYPLLWVHAVLFKTLCDPTQLKYATESHYSATCALHPSRAQYNYVDVDAGNAPIPILAID